MTDLLFYVFGSMALAGALGVVLGKNPVGSLLFMVLSLASVAGIFVLLEAHFLAAVQIMVYAGAIMVLFLFVIMLLNLGHEVQRDLITGSKAMLIGAPVAVALGLMGWAAMGTTAGLSTPGAAAAEIDAALLERGAVGAIAYPLFTDHLVAFELTGILLLVAIVGALVLAKRRV